MSIMKVATKLWIQCSIKLPSPHTLFFSVGVELEGKNQFWHKQKRSTPYNRSFTEPSQNLQRIFVVTFLKSFQQFLGNFFSKRKNSYGGNQRNNKAWILYRLHSIHGNKFHNWTVKYTIISIDILLFIFVISIILCIVAASKDVFSLPKPEMETCSLRIFKDLFSRG